MEDTSRAVDKDLGEVMECLPVHDHPPGNAFLTREGFLRHSQLFSIAAKRHEVVLARSAAAHLSNEIHKCIQPLHSPVLEPPIEQDAVESDKEQIIGGSSDESDDRRALLDKNPEGHPDDDVLCCVAPSARAADAMRRVLRALRMPSWRALCERQQADTGAAPILTLTDVLNPASAVYFAEFAELYRRFRAERKDPGPGREKRKDADEGQPKSALSIADHAWYLEHVSSKLSASDAARRQHLESLLPLERQLYRAAIMAGLRAHPDRYAHCTGRQASQIEVDLALRRRLLVYAKVPRFVRLAAEVTVDLSQTTITLHQQEEAQQNLAESEAPPLIIKVNRLKPGTKLPGQLHYLPKIIEEGGSKRPVKAFRKMPGRFWHDEDAPELIHDDCSSVWSAGALRTVLTSSGHWEIPVTISADGRRALFGKPLPPRAALTRGHQARVQRAAVLTVGEVDGLLRTERVTRWTLANTGGAGKPTYDLTVVSRGSLVMEQEADDNDRPAAKKQIQLVVKTEYLPAPDVEQETTEELANWSVKLALNRGVEHLLEVAVHVPTATIWDAHFWTAGELESLGGDSLKHNLARGRAMLYALHEAVAPTSADGISPLKPGKYLLTVGGESQDNKKMYIYTAAAGVAEAMQDDEEVSVLPLPIDTPEANTVYDVHAAHKGPVSSMPTKKDWDGIIRMPKWRPADPSIPQIPETLPPKATRLQLANDGAGKRNRKLSQPYAWKVLGQGGDFDAMATDNRLSAQEYAEALEGEL